MLIMEISEYTVSRTDIARRLKVSYSTVENYEEYGWLPKARRVKGANGKFYTEKDYINLVAILKSYNKIK
jgi:DNA-binding transcriptional MerR regulator